MCQCCRSFFCGIASALDNLFTEPAGCGCNGGNTGCGCNGGAANAVSNLFQGGCNNGCGGNTGCGCNSGCNGCGYDLYYAQQYALGPFSTGCNVCGF